MTSRRISDHARAIILGTCLLGIVMGWSTLIQSLDRCRVYAISVGGGGVVLGMSDSLQD